MKGKFLIFALIAALVFGAAACSLDNGDYPDDPYKEQDNTKDQKVAADWKAIIEVGYDDEEFLLIKGDEDDDDLPDEDITCNLSELLLKLMSGEIKIQLVSPGPPRTYKYCIMYNETEMDLPTETAEIFKPTPTKP